MDSYIIFFAQIYQNDSSSVINVTDSYEMIFKMLLVCFDLQSRNRIDFPIFYWATKIMSVQEIITLMNSGNLIRTFLILIKTSKFLSYDDIIY